jgi:hypothetical protein
MQASEDFKNLQKTAGWKRLEKWIGENRETTHKIMETDVHGASMWTVMGLLNHYVKYLFFLQENRAYTKIETYMKVTIQKGEQYAKEQQRRDELQKQKENKSR